jgi:hypothetical protein
MLKENFSFAKFSANLGVINSVAGNATGPGTRSDLFESEENKNIY